MQAQWISGEIIYQPLFTSHCSNYACEYSVVVGEHDLNADLEGTARTIKAERVFQHAAYGEMNCYAVIKL